MSAPRASHAPHPTDERDAARVRFVADVDVAAARAPSARRDDLAWLVARAFAHDASEREWSYLRRAVARLLDGDVRRSGASYERLRGFLIENDDLP